ncbi:MAG: substrate-binding domain-containing protein [Firmicutes bacterium]|nr:substrate-binding domain-containing protein [Bacillota bacterium]MBQ3123770.1 substrate-binding domain-containing protein [Bacillota bacterium]MBQ9972668.1 substrate-binding domain-containing protein [Bacillota bacterium]
MKRTKKLVLCLLTVVLVMGSFAACGNNDEGFSASNEIGVISREDGSGTRGAFIELFGIEQKNEAGEKIDNTTPLASITNSTAVMMTTVQGDKYSIGYISLGSLNDTVKAVEIEGVAASADNIEAGTYEAARPFNIVTSGEVSDLTADFIDFILSEEGQSIVEEAGYIAITTGEPYTGRPEGGKVVVSGSSSVTPVMEKIKEAYVAKNPDVTVEVQQSDSSTGVNDALDGTCNIGMSSRNLKESEIEKGAVSTVIAMDGIAVIVNNENPVTKLTKEQVKSIFTGETVTWDQIVSE